MQSFFQSLDWVFRHPWAVAIFLMAMAGIRDAWILQQGTAFIARSLTIDDTYYYLLTAWNHHIFEFPTFDGVNHTNGVQFLWYWILYLYKYLFATRAAFLKGSIVLCAILGIASIIPAVRLGRAVERRYGAALVGLAVFHLVTYRRFSLVGLENALHLFVILLLYAQFFRFLRLLGNRKTNQRSLGRRYLLIMALLAVNVWCRLDAAVISVALGVYTTIEFYFHGRARNQRPVRSIFLAFGLCGVLAATMLFGNYSMGGSAVPVSGLWKEGQRDEKPDYATFLAIWKRGITQVFPLESTVGEDVEAVAGYAFIPVTLIIFFFTAWRTRGNREWKRGFLVLTGVVFLHQLMLAIALGENAERGYWYQSPYFALVALMFPFFMNAIPTNSFIAKIPAWINVKSIVVLALLILIPVLQFKDTEKFIRKAPSRDELFAARLKVAEWVKANLPPEARIGSFNSGQLGYFSERSVTNLDGLINSYEYFIFRRNGGSRVDFLIQQNITYYVDYQEFDQIEPYRTLIHRQEREGDTAIDVYQLDFDATPET